MKSNLDVYNAVVQEYQDYELTPAEMSILHRFRNIWHKTKMLDIGVGTGRTSYTFAALVDQYQGIDYSVNMIERCRQVVGDYERCRIEVQDASDLSPYYAAHYDFILFSLNGIDSVKHETRLKILGEVRKVLRSDGYFFFSTHNLYAFPFTPALPDVSIRRPLSSIYRHLKSLRLMLRLRWHYRHFDKEAILDKSRATLITGDHDFQMEIYHIKPAHQVEQLHRAGFEVDTVYDKAGRIVDPLSYRGTSYLYFLCRPGKVSF